MWIIFIENSNDFCFVLDVWLAGVKDRTFDRLQLRMLETIVQFCHLFGFHCQSMVPNFPSATVSLFVLRISFILQYMSFFTCNLEIANFLWPRLCREQIIGSNKLLFLELFCNIKRTPSSGSYFVLWTLFHFYTVWGTFSFTFSGNEPFPGMYFKGKKISFLFLLLLVYSQFHLPYNWRKIRQ